QVEIVKALTPDMQADAIGGMINLSTRSPLSMSERRRFSYDFGVNVTSPWSDYKPEQQRDKNIQPFGQFSYTEVFDVGKGKRNLGISIDSFYGESQYEIGTLWYQYQANKPTDPVYIWDARARDSINNRQ